MCDGGDSEKAPEERPPSHDEVDLSEEVLMSDDAEEAARKITEYQKLLDAFLYGLEAGVDSCVDEEVPTDEGPIEYQAWVQQRFREEVWEDEE